MVICNTRVCPECQKAFEGSESTLYCSRDCQFWSMFDKSGGPDACWPWKCSIARNGYGRLPRGIVKDGGYSHRRAYRIAKGTDPGRFCVCHSCDFRACGNPAHLWLGTHRQNMMDAINKGRYMAVGPGESHALAKLTEEKVREILRSSKPAKALANRFGVKPSTIYAVRQRRTWTHVPLNPKVSEAQQLSL